MNLMPLPDLGWIPITAMIGVWGMILSFPLIILFEAAVLHRIFAEGVSFLRSLRDSFLVNLFSGLLGIIEIFLTDSYVWAVGNVMGERLGADYYTATPAARAVFLFVFVFRFWPLTVVVEGIALMRLKRGYPARRIWVTSLLANLVSYAGLFLALILILN